MQPEYPYRHCIGPPVTICASIFFFPTKCEFHSTIADPELEQVGKIMHYVVTRGRACNPDPRFLRFLLVKLDENDTTFLVSVGKLLLDAPYSVALRSLIFQCLACDWEKCPLARQLLADIELGIEGSEAALACRHTMEGGLDDDKMEPAKHYRFNMIDKGTRK